MKTSIEYAHIYTNQIVDDEHTESLDLLKSVKQELQGESNLVVMVDDYSFPDPTFSYENFFAWLDEKDAKPNLIIRESQLIPDCDKVLALMSDSQLKKSIVDYIKTKKYPCSLFIATWYLVRLGKVKTHLVPEDAISNILINILPESFKPFEDKGLEIIKEAGFEDILDNIHYRFIPGRLIA